MSVLPGSPVMTRSEALRGPALVGATGLAAATLLHFHDPHSSGSYGYCPFLAATGRPCPGCGGLRAVNDLTRGDVAAAISSNVLAVALVVAVGVAWMVWAVRRARGVNASMISLGARSGIVLFVGILAFGVLRNTPWGSWLAP